MKKKTKVSFRELTNGEKCSYYRKRANISKVAKWASVISPFGIVFGMKFNEYIQILDTEQTVKLSIGCILALIVAVIAVYKEFKHDEETKHIAPVVGWGVVLAFVFLFEIITKDLLLIVGAEFAGQCAAVGLDYYAKYATNEAKDYEQLAKKDNTYKTRKVKVRVSR